MKEETLTNVERYLCGDMTPDEQAAFLATVVESEEDLTYLGRAIVQDALLHEAAQEFEAEAVQATQFRTVVARHARRVAARVGRWLMWTVVAALVGLTVLQQIRMRRSRISERVQGVPHAARLLAVEGDVFVRTDKHELPAKAPSDVFRNNVVLTGRPSGKAVVMYRDGLKLTLKPGTSVRMGDPAGGREGIGSHAMLLTGALVINVFPVTPARDVRIVTPHGMLTARVATFSVNVGRDSTVAVLETGELTAAGSGDTNTVQAKAGELVEMGRTTRVIVPGTKAPEPVAVEPDPVIREPNEIPGLALWLKADGIPGARHGEPIAFWPDSSGNGFDALQREAARMPLFHADSATGRSVVRFDGSNDCLRGVAPKGYTDCTLFLAFAMTDVEEDRGLFVLAGRGADDVRGAGGLAVMQRDGAAGSTLHMLRATVAPSERPENAHLSANVQPGTFTLLGFTFDRGRATVRQNGKIVGRDDYVSTVPCLPSEYALSTRLSQNKALLHGRNDIAEAIFYPHALTAAELSDIEAYLARKYNVSLQ